MGDIDTQPLPCLTPCTWFCYGQQLLSVRVFAAAAIIAAALAGAGVAVLLLVLTLLRLPLLSRLLQASDHGSSSLSHLVSIFVERSHTLWRTQDVQAWLKAAAEVAADMAGGWHERISLQLLLLLQMCTSSE